MTTARNVFLGVFFLSVTVITLGGLFWANLLFAQRNPGGAEILTLWSGSRAYTINALNPYSVVVADQVQRQVYGRLARASEPVYRVDAPLHYILLFTPLAMVENFTEARAWWLVISQGALVVFSLLGFSLVQWHPPLPIRVLVVLAGLFWAYAALALFEGSLVVIVGLLFATALMALRAESDELAGILLAFATVKAEAGILFLTFIFVWSVIQQRWGVISGFFMAWIVLAGIGWLFQPDWLWELLRAVVSNLESGPLVRLGTLLETRLPGIGARASQALTGLVAAILLIEWYAAARVGEFRHMLWTAMLTLSLTPLSGLPAEASNHILLFLPLLLSLSVMDERWGRFGRATAVIILILAVAGFWLLLVNTGGQSRALIAPLPVALAGLLYWVRWWAVRPPRTWRDQASAAPGRI